MARSMMKIIVIVATTATITAASPLALNNPRAAIAAPSTLSTQNAASTSAITIHHPCPLFCNADGVCGCAAEPPVDSGRGTNHKRTAVVKGSGKKRNTDIVRPCPDYCTADGVCGCDILDLEDHQPVEKRATDIIRPCPDYCTADGVCGCDILDQPATLEKRAPLDFDIIHPCPDICNAHGVCGCGLFDIPEHFNGTNITTPLPKTVHVVANPGRVKPCPQICNNKGVCVCAEFQTSAKDDTKPLDAKKKLDHLKIVLEPGRVKPCPQVCNNKGVCVCAAVVQTNVNGTAEHEHLLEKVKVKARQVVPVEEKVPGRLKPCPQICDVHGKCVCADLAATEKNAKAAEELEKSNVPVKSGRVKPCPQICNNKGVCVCAVVAGTNPTLTTSVVTHGPKKMVRHVVPVADKVPGRVKPCPQICNNKGVCVCATTMLGGTNSTTTGNDTATLPELSKLGKPSVVEVGEEKIPGRIKPCPQVCDKKGNCGVCA